MCDPDSDGAAIALLKRAVELDMSRRYTEALVCYKEGLQLLLEFIKVSWCCVTMPCLNCLMGFSFRQSVIRRRSQNID